MSDRQLPVRPNLDQLKRQARDLLRDIRSGDRAAVADLLRFHPKAVDVSAVKLADAQLVLARSYGVASWPRLALACRVVDAIWRDEVDMLRDLILKHPKLLHAMARGTESCNWGPPMSYAANLGRNRIIAMLKEIGAKDVERALGRAILQGQIGTARQLYDMGARPPRGEVMGPAETQNGAGMAYLLELGAEICDEKGDRLAPVGMLLETYSRNPEGKHQCLELFESYGIEIPNTPVMAMHRGRIDLLEEHLKRDSALFGRTFTHGEIYPQELGCHDDESLALHGTPIAGGTLLHLAVDNDEIEVARWMLSKGADTNARAVVDSDRFGGHTALYGCVVSQPFVAGRRRDDAFARLLLDHGANPNARASLRKRLRFVTDADDDFVHEYRAVTPLAWGEQFHNRGWVNPSVMKLIEERGGHR